MCASALTGYTPDSAPTPLLSWQNHPRLRSLHRPLLSPHRRPSPSGRPGLALVVSQAVEVGDQPYPLPAVALSLAEGRG